MLRLLEMAIRRKTLHADLWNPAWYRAPIFLIFRPKLARQRRLLVKQHKEIDDHEYAGQVFDDVPGAKEHGLSKDDRRHADVHRIANVTMESFHDKLLRGSNRRWCAAPAHRESPKSRVQIDGDANSDQKNCNRSQGDVRRGRILTMQPPRKITGDRAGHEDRKQKRAKEWFHVSDSLGEAFKVFGRLSEFSCTCVRLRTPHVCQPLVFPTAS